MFLGGVEISNTSTTNGGQYGFSNDTAGWIYNVSQLVEGGSYELRITSVGSGSLAGLDVTTLNTGGVDANTDQRDNDASSSGSTATVAFTLSSRVGENNHSFDFGFRAAPAVAFCPSNLLLNGSFELPGSNTADLDIWLDNVEATNSAGMIKPDGLFYAVQNAGKPFTQDVAISGTNTYTLTFHAGSHDPAAENNVVHLQYLDASDTLISEVTHTISYDVDLTSPQTLSPERTLNLGASPANATKIRVSVETLAGFSKVDAMCLLATTVATGSLEISKAVTGKP